MPKSIQIRDIDDEVYLGLRRRAAEAGVSVPELLRAGRPDRASRPGLHQRGAARRSSALRRSCGRLTSCAMLVVDASCLAEVVLAGPDAEPVRERFADEPDQVAPHLVDAEVLGVVRRAHLRGEIDRTAAGHAIRDLGSWPATRVDHRPLLGRAWQLRDCLSAPDALYVALAEALGAPLLTLDRRLAQVSGLRCQIEIPQPPCAAPHRTAMRSGSRAGSAPDQ